MTALVLSQPGRKLWGGSFTIAVSVHVLAGVAILAMARPFAPLPPEPVMLVELPPLPPPAAAAADPVTPQMMPDMPQPVLQPMPPIDVPQVRVPVPSDAVIVPVQPVHPTTPAPTPAPVMTNSTPAPVTAPAAPSVGDDPRARKAELNYYQMLMAYLARKKAYPPEARQARQQGVVTIRFTVDRNGNVSGEGVKRSSGFAVLDSATLALLRRVSPLPAMPSSMNRDSVTVSLPIEYSLTTK
jgi:protein TonB